MRKEIIVNIGYMEFNFNSVDKAVSFAEDAIKTIKDKNRDISIDINFYNDDDDKEEQ